MTDSAIAVMVIIDTDREIIDDAAVDHANRITFLLSRLNLENLAKDILIKVSVDSFFTSLKSLNAGALTFQLESSVDQNSAQAHIESLVDHALHLRDLVCNLLQVIKLIFSYVPGEVENILICEHHHFFGLNGDGLNMKLTECLKCSFA